jgi:hypothetical protein
LHWVTQDWWDGVPVYAMHRSGMVYPPATWVLLGPMFACTTLDASRWMWAGAALIGLAALGAVCARAVQDNAPLIRASAWLAPFSMPALGDALGSGTLTTVLLPLAVWAVLLSTRAAPTWSSDFAAAGLFVLALADPRVSLPFLGPLLVAPRRIRPAVLAVAGYSIVTGAAASLHPGNSLDDIRLWLDHLHRQAGGGYGNIQDSLYHLGWNSAFAPASLILLVSLGAFTWWCRRSDIWLLLAITAIAARLWMAPRIDHDAVLLIPLMATARLASQHPVSGGLVVSARVMLIPLAAILWIPLHFHFAGSTVGPWLVQRSWVRLFDAAHVTATLLTLCILAAGAIATRAGDCRSTRSESSDG